MFLFNIFLTNFYRLECPTYINKIYIIYLIQKPHKILKKYYIFHIFTVFINHDFILNTLNKLPLLIVLICISTFYSLILYILCRRYPVIYNILYLYA